MFHNHLVGLPETLESLDDDDPNIKPIQLGSISAYESRLLQALREHPDRMEYWTKKGRIDKNHKFLLELYSKFFEILAGYGINYWLDFGSLLGYIRHHGIFPWEYDMDIGILQEEFPKIEVIAEHLEKEGSDWAFKWHTYEDWDSAPDYVFYNKKVPDVFCDLTLYNNDNGILKCYRPEWNYPEYRYDDVFPSRKVIIFGQPAQIPFSPERVLKLSEKVLGQITVGEISNVNRVKWMQYDPIPFLLCQLYNPKFTQLLCTYSLKSTPKFKSLLQIQNKDSSSTLAEESSSGEQHQKLSNLASQSIDQIIQSISISSESSHSQITLDCNLIAHPIHFQSGEQNITLKDTQEIQENLFETPDQTKSQFEQFELVQLQL